MSRLALAFTLLATLTSVASADRIAEPVQAARMMIAPPVLDRDALRAKLIANRTKNLAAFRAYQTAGVFPSNVYTQSSLNVWRDDDGHFCAAATIIRTSGNVALVDQVAEQNNFIRLADVTQGPVMDWILTSGFTQAELVLIQRPFRPVTKPDLAKIDPKLRTAETARLAKLYQRIDATLVRNRKRSIELALDRLMQHPAAARALLASPSSVIVDA